MTGGNVRRMQSIVNEEAEFRLVVREVFTITGRGLVAAGSIESGAIRTGEVVNVVHEGRVQSVECRGVEIIRTIRPLDYVPVGLLLPELTKDDVAAGDPITRGPR